MTEPSVAWLASAHQASVNQFARKLSSLARIAWATSETSSVLQIAATIEKLPVCDGLQAVGNYYRALCVQQSGDEPHAWQILSGTLPKLKPEYLPRAILAVGNFHFRKGAYKEAKQIYLEAAALSRDIDPISASQALRAIAVVKSTDGDHLGALTDLKALFPAAVALADASAAGFYGYLNSLAIELGEVGRVDEANRIIDYVLRAPFADKFPWWLDTKVQLQHKPRLAFPPFTMALGGVGQSEALSKSDAEIIAGADRVSESELRPRVQPVADATVDRREKTKPSVLVKLPIIGLAAKSAGRSGQIVIDLRVPVWNPHPRPAQRGRAMSPPSRAPPCYLPPTQK